MNKKILMLSFAVIFFLSGITLVFVQEVPPEEFHMPGTIEGEGTYFEITDSDYLNITLESTEPINLLLESMSGIIIMDIKSVSDAASTQITISGLMPLTTYYKYEDNIGDPVEFMTDENGNYVYTQDLSEIHLVFIQTCSSTNFIRDDATGGDCTSIGNWDPITKTCTLITDVTEAIQIVDNGITLDGNGHVFTDCTDGTLCNKAGAIYLFRVAGCTIKNFIIDDPTLYSGIYLRESDDNTIIDNDFLNQDFGIYLSLSDLNTIKNNLLKSNLRQGIIIRDSSNNIITENTIDSVEMYYGIYIFRSSNNNQIYNNNFINNPTQAYVDGTSSGNIFNLAEPIGGNFWSDWRTPDSDGDGFVDDPYVFTGGQDNLPHVCPFGGVAVGDSMPPITTAELSGILGNNDWYISDVILTLTAIDPPDQCGQASGVDYIQYGAKGKWATYTEPLIYFLDHPGLTRDYRAIDNEGNVEETKSLTFKIDKTPPTITCPVDVSVHKDIGLCYATGVDIGTATAIDKNGIDSVFSDATEPYPVGDTIVTWTAVDMAGLTATCEQIVTVTADVEVCDGEDNDCDGIIDNGGDALCGDDGLWCNGQETCQGVLGCVSTDPPDCNDAVSCTDDSCNEETDSCDNIPNDNYCPTDDWFDIGLPYWLNVPPCDRKEMQDQEYRDNYCDVDLDCQYTITDTGSYQISYEDNDEDDDSVCNDVDKCFGTTPWYAEQGLKPNHYDSSNLLDLTETYGCDCNQILYCKPGDDKGEYKFGCTEGTLNVWTEQIGWSLDCQIDGKVIQPGADKSFFTDTDGDWWIDALDGDADNDGVINGEDSMIEDADLPGTEGYGTPDWYQ